MKAVKSARDCLNPRQRLFAEEYMVDHIATRAAIRAGYSPQSANQQASALLAHPKVRAYIDEMTAEKSKRLGISSDRVLEELAKIGFANVEDIANAADGGLKLGASRDDTAAIASIRVKRTVGPAGETIERELKMHDKHKALDTLQKYLKITEPETVNLNATIQITDDVPPEVATTVIGFAIPKDKSEDEDE